MLWLSFLPDNGFSVASEQRRISLAFGIPKRCKRAIASFAAAMQKSCAAKKLCGRNFIAICESPGASFAICGDGLEVRRERRKRR
jgi:hypothetical protein